MSFLWKSRLAYENKIQGGVYSVGVVFGFLRSTLSSATTPRTYVKSTLSYTVYGSAAPPAPKKYIIKALSALSALTPSYYM